MMSKIKVRMRFECFCLKRMAISSIISRCIEATLKAEKVDMPCEINVLVTNDEGIRGINKVCRNIDKATDVLSFPMFQFTAGEQPDSWDEFLDPATGRCPLGDMAISYERAIAQAKDFGHSVRREVGYLTIHSMLHLLGYDHLDEGPMKRQMRAREEAIANGISGMSRE